MLLNDQDKRTLENLYVCLIHPDEGSALRLTVLTEKTREQMQKWLSSVLKMPQLRLDTCMNALDLIVLNLQKGDQRGFFMSSGDGIDHFVQGTDEIQALADFEKNYKKSATSWCESSLLEKLLNDLQEDMDHKDVLVDPLYEFNR